MAARLGSALPSYWAARRVPALGRRGFPPLLVLAGMLAGLAAPVQPARAHLMSFLEPAQQAHFDVTRFDPPPPTGAVNQRGAQDWASRRFVPQRSTPSESPFAKVAFNLDVDGRMAIGDGTDGPGPGNFDIGVAAVT